MEERGEIVPGLGGEVRPLVAGPDGRIYGTGTRGQQVGLYICHPKLRKVVKDFGAVGPRHPNGAWSRYVMGVDDTHAYIASGMIPAWYLVAVELGSGSCTARRGGRMAGSTLADSQSCRRSIANRGSVTCEYDSTFASLSFE